MEKPLRPVRVHGPAISQRLKERAELATLWGSLPYPELLERFPWLAHPRNIKRYHKHSRG